MKTEEEKIEEVLRLTAEVWNKYLELEVEHPSEVNEFATCIHNIQDKLAVKIARIYRPDLYPNKTRLD